MSQEENCEQKHYWEKKHYWPFEALPPESQTEQHKCEQRFFEAAYQEGYSPYMDGIGNLGATSSEREAWIVVRGRSRWEVRLWTSDQGTLQEIVSAQFADFNSAAEAVLLWLRGLEGAEVVERVRGNLLAPSSSRTPISGWPPSSSAAGSGPI